MKPIQLAPEWDTAPDVIQLSDTAVVLWLKCATYALRHGTGGFVPVAAMKSMVSGKTALAMSSLALANHGFAVQTETGIRLLTNSALFADFTLTTEAAEHIACVNPEITKILEDSGSFDPDPFRKLGSPDQCRSTGGSEDLQNAPPPDLQHNTSPISYNHSGVLLSPPLKAPPPLTGVQPPHNAQELAPRSVRQVFEHWQAVMGHPGAKLDRKRVARVKARLGEGYDPETLCRAISGAALSDWHMGRDPKSEGRRYDGIETVLRDAAQVDKFVALFEASQPKQPKKPVEKRAEPEIDSSEYVKEPPEEFKTAFAKLMQSAKVV